MARTAEAPPADAADLENRTWSTRLERARRWVLSAGRPLGAAVIGCGQAAPAHVEAYRRCSLARVTAVADERTGPLADARQRWRGVRTFRDWRRLLREVRPNLVSVCTWPESHAEIVAAAAQAGAKAILCERPLALRLDEIDRMLAACREHHVRLAVAHPWRFHPCFVHAAHLVRSGLTGPILALRGHMVGNLADSGSHLMDAARFLAGDPTPRSVACRTQRQRGRRFRGMPAEDSAAGRVTFAGGFSLEFQTGEAAPSFLRIAVEGARATVVVTPECVRIEEGSRAEDHAPPPWDVRELQFRQFVRWACGRQETYPADARSAVWAAEMVLAAYESSRLGTPVELPMLERGDVIRRLYPGEEPAPDAAPPPDPLPPVAKRRRRLAVDGGRPAVRRWSRADASIGLRERWLVQRVLRTGRLDRDSGTQVARLEARFAAEQGAAAAVACSSGTAALHVAVAALGLEPLDEVVLPAATDVPAVIAVLAANCVPVFADVDPLTGHVTPDAVASCLGPRTRAVVVAHALGRPADVAPLHALCRQQRVALIEDATRALGARDCGRAVGTLGDVGCFDLGPGAIATAGEGGLLLVNRPELAERVALLADEGRGRGMGRGPLLLGMNYRMTELQAAVAIGQLARLPHNLLRRRAAAERLASALRPNDWLALPADRPGDEPAWWAFALHVEEERLGLPADTVYDILRAEGVPVLRCWPERSILASDLLRRQRTYGESRYPFSAADRHVPPPESFPGLQAFRQRSLMIPWSERLGRRRVARIARAFGKVAAARREGQRLRHGSGSPAEAGLGVLAGL